VQRGPDRNLVLESRGLLLCRARGSLIQTYKPMPLRTQNTFSVISALGSPGPARAAPSLGVDGWCWLGHRLPIGWCYWDYPIVPISLCVVVGPLAHIPITYP
jgi:hypothetical protein